MRLQTKNAGYKLEQQFQYSYLRQNALFRASAFSLGKIRLTLKNSAVLWSQHVCSYGIAGWCIWFMDSHQSSYQETCTESDDIAAKPFFLWISGVRETSEVDIVAQSLVGGQ